MSGLQITITSAGRAALVNAANTGTLPVTVSQLGITAAAFTPDAALTAIPAEIKRLGTVGGQAVADDTIHVTASDNSSDTYSMKGFGLYLADGTLFACYSQATEIVGKAAAATMLLAADIRFADILASSITFGDATFLNPPGSETVIGVLQLASDAETIAGADNTKAVHAKGLKAALDARFGAGAPSAFVKGLLTAATAAAMRLAIGLGNAATRNEGAGNGLDADKLDGNEGAYYLDWNNLANRPATYPPSAHSTAWADIVGAPATATRWADWGEITGKPVTFAPSPHVHAAADITSGTFDTARIPALPIAQTTGLQSALDSKIGAGYYGIGTAATPMPGDDCNLAVNCGFYAIVSTTANVPAGAGSGDTLITMAWGSTNCSQMIVGRASNRVWYRRQASGGWAAWYEAYTTSNFNPATKLDLAGGTMSGGLSMGASTVASITDLSRHLQLHTAGWGLNVTSGTLNYVVGSAGKHQFVVNGVSVAQITATAFNIDTAFTADTMQATTSDRRLKTEIEDLRGCLELVRKLRPRSYRWIKTGEKDFGWIAQEHAEHLPGAVHQADPREDGEPGLMHVRYGKAEPLIVGALQEIADRLERLEARILSA